ncbi:MAG: hypothetical protein IPJ07_01060 [Acidobacteria bacterium]|nr:hypothetical protein [Acidobacteriota bacterium]
MEEKIEDHQEQANKDNHDQELDQTEDSGNDEQTTLDAFDGKKSVVAIVVSKLRTFMMKVMSLIPVNKGPRGLGNCPRVPG